MFNTKKLVVLGAAVLALAACGNNTSTPSEDEKEVVRLKVWGPTKVNEDKIYEHLASEFQKKHPEIEFSIDFGNMDEGDTKTEILKDVNAAADIFMFADDHLSELVSKGVLAELSTGYANTIKERDVASAVAGATVGEKMYAFPVAADNGYFLYYNNAFYTEEDVKSLEIMLSKASIDNQITLDFPTGYYSMSPVLNVGTINYDAETGLHTTDFGSQKVKDAMKGFFDLVNPKIDKGLKPTGIVFDDMKDENGNKIVAGVSGTWDAENVQKALGDKYAATKLPTYKSADGSTVQMGSFAGSKLVGVKSTSLKQNWAFAFADFITNEDAQAYRYGVNQKGPSNKNVSASEAVQENIALAALGLQANYAVPQGKSVGDSFWEASAAVGNFIVKPTAGKTIEDQLDLFVDAITKK